ncbi:response regulator transcription factor [Actinomadura rudentiformis]|uniref:Response regulator transcription factor n=1 Tax=Actinomadura rudentiformis TaxID=359158 RepID=A0A6H9YDZ1_9ACTN|nr:response regulator transcription factor [Actinomadura rudentiformis]KAB2342488.1 response regulator transcription factor [Actinomadura rudentiformis]
MRVLVVEDQADLVEILLEGLRAAGMAVDSALGGVQAQELLAVNDYDVVVLDRDLPDVHGDEVCRELIEGGALTRVLMLTAAGAVDDRVEGLSLGADDYLAKPFDFAELVARIRALGRRARPPIPPVLVDGDLVMDTARRVATRGGRPLRLTAKEFGVLEVLLGADGAVVTSEQLLERVWDEHTDPFTNTVRVTMMRLRRKLGEPGVVATLPSAGYRIVR